MRLAKAIRKYHRHFLLAAVFHVALVIIFIYCTFFSDKGNSYLKGNKISQAQLVATQGAVTRNLTRPRSLPYAQPPTGQNMTEGQGSLLLQLLRHAIQEKQYYP